MPILAGFHVEGNDYLILRAFVAKVLQLEELLILGGQQSVQRKPRSGQKQQLYGKPVATRADVNNIALPLVRSMTAESIAALAQTSPSFRNFHDQIAATGEIILRNADCW